MSRKRRYTNEEFASAVKESCSIREVLLRLGLKGAGGNYELAKKRIKELGLDSQHFTGQGHLKGKKNVWSKKHDLSDVLVENSSYVNTNKLRKRLFCEGVFERKCQVCGGTEWLGNPMPLELEHINGIKSDHRLSNLKILCPNCHALTPTYRGKNIGKHGRMTELADGAVLKTVGETRPGSNPGTTTSLIESSQ